MNKILFGILWCALCVFIQTVDCQVRLPRLISDGMVLQRDARVKVWGWAAPGEKITVTFIGRTYTAKAGTDSAWSVTVGPFEAGGPHTMEIHASNDLTVANIMMGDVWVCSGQSNMALPMARVEERYSEEIALANNPAIRHFSVPMAYDFSSPRDDMQAGTWEPADSSRILHFSATGYFFARALFEKYQVPIGLINASIGGTPIDAWMSRDVVKQFPASMEIAEKYAESGYSDQIRKEDSLVSAGWYDNLRQLDNGYERAGRSWFDSTCDVSAWPSMRIPGFWDEGGLGPVNGVVWFRREFDVPASMTCRPAVLRMGRIVDSDSVYINGRFAGTISYQYPPRIYPLPPDLLKAGKNVIAVRVVNTSGRGGFIKDKPYEISADSGVIDLKGEWKYRLGAAVNPLRDPTFIQYKPVGLFNGMIAPLVKYAVTGVIWYQGESNTGNTIEYQKMFPAMISDWRKKWNRGNFPFLFVQLHNFMAASPQPSESNWARLREAQQKALSLPNTGMVVAIDVGEWNDIHPLNKEAVGRRLALAAQKIAYGDPDVVYSGPVYESMKIEGRKIVLTFSHTGSGLYAKGGGELRQFAIAGTDKKFMWAHAVVDGKTVVVWNNEVVSPVAVRYAWADNPEGANLYNLEGLPASPFRTDDKHNEGEVLRDPSRRNR